WWTLPVAAALLGMPMGVLAMTLVIVIQSLLFADGGLSVMGVNIMSMAIIGAGLGGGLFELLSMGAAIRSRRGMAALAVASWLSVVLASSFVSAMLVIDGASKAGAAFPAMFNVHAIIGIGEAILTMAIVWAFAPVPTSASSRRSVAMPLVTAIVVGGLLGPFACGYPDGLEWVADRLAFVKHAAPAFVAPMSDYSVNFVSNEMLSTAVAGVAGVIITFVVAWAVGLAFKPQTSLA
ncbi:MAG TPA: energy-coupling factor ABC transporter permease, partial [Phycisphaerae bacterium]|nr:energy-coupling factor ABC transporter permease [Phycisphaerae bacterium]